MFLHKLRLHNFRNLQGDGIILSPGVNFILGQNAQGKTNLVEAVSFLAFAKSLRTQSTQELPRWGERSCSVFGEIERSDSRFEVGISIDNGAKQVFLNGDRLSSVSDYAGKLLCVSFTPDDLQLIKGAPVERRRFMDRYISEAYPRFLTSLVSYNRALKSKSKLLSNGRPGASEIRPWNSLLIKHGLEILKKRRDFLAEIGTRVNSIHKIFAPSDGPLELLLKTNLEVSTGEPDIHSLEDLYERNMQREIDGHACFLGVHRDDMEIFIDCRAARTFASQGQVRSVTLSLKMAVVELLESVSGETPVVLLDDLDSELDRTRRELLFDMVLAQKRQVFITGTELRIDPLRYNGEHALLEVTNGLVRLI